MSKIESWLCFFAVKHEDDALRMQHGDQAERARAEIEKAKREMEDGAP